MTYSGGKSWIQSVCFFSSKVNSTQSCFKEILKDFSKKNSIFAVRKTAWILFHFR